MLEGEKGKHSFTLLSVMIRFSSATSTLLKPEFLSQYRAEVGFYFMFVYWCVCALVSYGIQVKVRVQRYLPLNLRQVSCLPSMNAWDYLEILLSTPPICHRCTGIPVVFDLTCVLGMGTRVLS